MVQYYPLNMKQNLTDCSACIIQQPEVGYEQYDNVHAMLEVHINRSSLIPEVMRLRWFPTTSDPIFADAGIQVMPMDSRAYNLPLRFCHEMQCIAHVPTLQDTITHVVNMDQCAHGSDYALMASLLAGAADHTVVVLQRELPQLEAHFIQNAQLAQYVTEWHPYRAASLTVQVSIVSVSISHRMRQDDAACILNAHHAFRVMASNPKLLCA